MIALIAFYQALEEVPKTLVPKKMIKYSKRFKKNFKNKLQMFLKVADVKIFKNKSITSRSHAVTYNQTLEEVMWLLSLEKPKK